MNYDNDREENRFSISNNEQNNDNNFEDKNETKYLNDEIPLDGEWERSDRSLISASIIGLIGIGLFYFFGQTVLLIGFLFADALSRGSLEASFDAIYTDASYTIWLALIVSQFVVMLLPVRNLTRKWHSSKPFLYLRFRNFSIKEVLLAVLGTLAIFPFGTFISNSIQSVFPMPDEITKIVEELFSPEGWGEFGIMVLVIAITPAICEETFFRGYVQGTMERVKKSPVPFIVVGIIFGLFHQNPLGLIELSLIGIFLGYLFYRSDSIYPSMAAHFTNNFFVLCIYFFSRESQFFEKIKTGEYITIYWAIAGLILSIVIIYIFHRITAKKSKTDVNIEGAN